MGPPFVRVVVRVHQQPLINHTLSGTMFDDSCSGAGNAAKTAANQIVQNQQTASLAQNPQQNITQGGPQVENAPGAANEFMAGWNGEASGLSAQQEEELATAFGGADIMGNMPFNGNGEGMPEDSAAWLEQYAAQMEQMGMSGSGFGMNDPPPAPTYQLTPSNRFAGAPVPLQQGIEAYQRGDLQEAIEMLETTAQGEQLTEAGEAWRWLGMAHAETDDDRQAIAALLRSVETDGSNLDALLELGVSCTNELDQTQALAFLETWIESHPVYREVIGTVGPAEDSIGTWAQTERVTQLFKNASELAYNDADPFMALGVLCNLSREYDEAANWFKKALQIKPSSHSLWNKLGATQANGSRSKDALHAYNQALALKPTYVRAWINTGISYSNQSQYEQACAYFLKGLTLSPDSNHVWSYIRMAFTCMDRADLTQKLNGADKPTPEMFRDDFKF